MAWFRLFACGEDFPVVIDGEVVTSAADPVPLDVHREAHIEVR